MSAGLKGAASGFVFGDLFTPTGGIGQFRFAFANGRLGNVRVQGAGVLSPGDPKPYGLKYDSLSIALAKRKPFVFELEMVPIEAPVSSGSSSATVTDLMSVTQVNPKGPFAHDLGATLSLSIVEKPKIHGQNLSISFSPR
jgi:hypothetical protein